MKEYLISYKCTYSIVIEAENEDDALAKFWEPENLAYACESINDQPLEVEEVEEYEG